MPHNNPLLRPVIGKVLDCGRLSAAPEQVRLARVLTRHPAAAERGRQESATVALTDIEAARVRRAVSAFVEGRRPPRHLRQEVDLAFRLSGQSVEILKCGLLTAARPGKRLNIPSQRRPTYARHEAGASSGSVRT